MSTGRAYAWAKCTAVYRRSRAYDGETGILIAIVSTGPVSGAGWAPVLLHVKRVDPLVYRQTLLPLLSLSLLSEDASTVREPWM